MLVISGTELVCCGVGYARNKLSRTLKTTPDNTTIRQHRLIQKPPEIDTFADANKRRSRNAQSKPPALPVPADAHVRDDCNILPSSFQSYFTAVPLCTASQHAPVWHSFMSHQIACTANTHTHTASWPPLRANNDDAHSSFNAPLCARFI